MDETVRRVRSELESAKEKALGDLNTMEIGYQRKLDEIVWMEYFIKFQIDKLQPQAYIDKYFTHLKMQDQFVKELYHPNYSDLAVLDC